MTSQAAAATEIPVPTAEQLHWQRLELGAFFHFGVNTFANLEWSDGTVPASAFDPSDLDVGEWLDTAVAAGARYAILTAKHHDGFCLWPTATTDYSVASSPWRDGGGDLVGEFVAACRKRGVLPGLYLSPWDRHEPSYTDPQAYSEFYARQLTELCTQYGPIAEIWLDGAGSEGYIYDWARIMQVIDAHQPNTIVFNMGRPSIRWVGNEDGLANDPVEYVVTHTMSSQYTNLRIGLPEAAYLPPECDVSLRRGWFWHEKDAPKTLEHLLGIYYRSIGLGANLLLNIPPDTRGRIDPLDARVITEFGAELQRRFGTPLVATLTPNGDGEWLAVFDVEVTVDHVRVREDLTRGQRATGHELMVGGTTIAKGHSIGVGRVHVLAAPVTTRELTVRVDGATPALSELVAFRTGHTMLPRIPDDYTAPTGRPDEHESDWL